MTLITDLQRVEINYLLAPYGLEFISGSINPETRELSALIDQKAAATYNMDRVALVLMDYFKIDDVVLDGKNITRKDAQESARRTIHRTPQKMPDEWFLAKQAQAERERERLRRRRKPQKTASY